MPASGSKLDLSLFILHFHSVLSHRAFFPTSSTSLLNSLCHLLSTDKNQFDILHLLCIVFSEQKFIEPAITLHQENIFVAWNTSSLLGRENGNENRSYIQSVQYLVAGKHFTAAAVLMHVKIKQYICYSFHFLKGVAPLHTLGKYFELKEYHPRFPGMGDVLLLFYRGYSLSGGLHSITTYYVNCTTPRNMSPSWIIDSAVIQE